MWESFEDGWSSAAGYVWDPGPGTLGYRFGDLKKEGRGKNISKVFYCLSKVEINKLAHIQNGNRGQRGRGIVCTYWNKGPSLLKNKQQDIMSVIDMHKPHILGLGEANFRQEHNLADVNVQGYHLHLHSALGSNDLGNTSRIAVYTHELLRVKRRRDLESDQVATYNTVFVEALTVDCTVTILSVKILCIFINTSSSPTRYHHSTKFI